MKYLSEIHRLVLAFVILAMCSLWIQAGEPIGALARFGESRSWSNDTGQFRIDGAMQSATEKEVTILKADNRIIQVPLDKLSEKDRTFVQEFLKAEAEENDPANPFAGGKPVNPFAGGVPAQTMAAGNQRGVASHVVDGIREAQATSSGARLITIAPIQAMWETSAPLAYPETQLEDATMPVPLAARTFSKLILKAGGRTPMVVMSNYRHSHHEEETFSDFVVVDPIRLESSSVYSFEQAWKLLAVSPNGEMMAAVRVIGFDKGSDLAIFKIVGNQLQPMYWFTAGGGDWDEIYSANFLPGNRLATLTEKKNLTVWSLDEEGPRALYRGVGESLTTVFSPAGELLIVPAEKNIAAIDTTSMKLVGCIERDTAADALAISPDGQFLAVFHPFTITIYSLETGAQLKQFAVAESSSRARLDWVGKYIMLGDVVYDFERELPVWTYTGRPDSAISFDEFLLSGFEEKPSSTLTIVKIPHAAAIAAAEGVDPKSIYALVPGEGIKLTVHMPGTPASVQEEAQRAAQAKIDASGWVRLDNAPVVMELRIERQEQATKDYYTRNEREPYFPFSGFRSQPSGPAEKVTYTPWKHSLIIRQGSQVLYQTSRTYDAPTNLQLGENESTQSAVNRAVKPDGKYFETVKVPPFVLKPEYQGGLGKSSLSAQGLK